jgi:hypothetical protein
VWFFWYSVTLVSHCVSPFLLFNYWSEYTQGVSLSTVHQDYFTHHSDRDIKQVYSVALVEGLEQCDVVFLRPCIACGY